MNEDIQKVLAGFYIGVTFGLAGVVLELQRRRSSAER